MKISINTNSKYEETEVVINCKELTGEIEDLIATLRISNKQMVVKKDDESYLISVKDIIYVESIDRKTFVYTNEDIYETKLKLYEIESKLFQSGFFRASKSCLVNFNFIKSIKNDIERRLKLTMQNGEQIIVSRQYSDEIKRRLEV